MYRSPSVNPKYFLELLEKSTEFSISATCFFDNMWSLKHKLSGKQLSEAKRRINNENF